MPSPTVRAVLFDLDGTLIDSIDLLLSSVRHAFAEHRGRIPTDEEWSAGIGTPLAVQLRPFAATDEELHRLLERYRMYQREHHDRLTRCFDDVPDTVATLARRGYRMGVVTSKADDLATRSLEYVGLASFMDVVIGVGSSTRHKPDPDPVRVALARLGCRPDEAVFVGDSPHDIASGNAAGVITVAALWGQFRREQIAPEGPTYYLDRISRLPELLERLPG